MKVLKKIGIAIEIISVILFITAYLIIKRILKINILFFSLMLLGAILQIPNEVYIEKENKNKDYLDRKYLMGLILSCFMFTGIIIFLIINY